MNTFNPVSHTRTVHVFVFLTRYGYRVYVIYDDILMKTSYVECYCRIVVQSSGPVSHRPGVWLCDCYIRVYYSNHSGAHSA